MRNAGTGPNASDRCGGTVEFAYTIFARADDP
jgi:hypothetical protein